MNCHKIYLAHVVFSSINTLIEKVENEKVRAYGLARFSILTVIKKILENDELGKKILITPCEYLKREVIKHFKDSINKLFNLIVLDYNAFIYEFSKDQKFFDYKNLFKNKEFCGKLTNAVLTAHKKAVVRHPEDSFEQIYTEFQN